MLALALAGCGATGSSSTSTNAVTATATTAGGVTNALTIYISDPPAVKSDPALQDVVYGEQLAFAGGQHSIRNGGLRLRTLTGRVSDNARNAIADTSAVAYLGEVQQGQSRQTVGITNAQDLLELTPTDTVVPIKNDYEANGTYGRTWASVAGGLGTGAAQLAAADKGFVTTFTRDYQHKPSADAIYGYTAMQLLLKVLVAAGNQVVNRQNIVHGVKDTLAANKGATNVANFSVKFK